MSWCAFNGNSKPFPNSPQVGVFQDEFNVVICSLTDCYGRVVSIRHGDARRPRRERRPRLEAWSGGCGLSGSLAPPPLCVRTYVCVVTPPDDLYQKEAIRPLPSSLISSVAGRTNCLGVPSGVQ